MAESSENIAKSGENPENGAKLKENCKTSSPVNGKGSVGVTSNGNCGETSKSIISQKSSLTPSHKSVHTSSSSSGCTKEASNINHVAPKAEGKSKTDSKSSHESSRDKKKHDGNGENKQ